MVLPKFLQEQVILTKHTKFLEITARVFVVCMLVRDEKMKHFHPFITYLLLCAYFRICLCQVFLNFRNHEDVTKSLCKITKNVHPLYMVRKSWKWTFFISTLVSEEKTIIWTRNVSLSRARFSSKWVLLSDKHIKSTKFPRVLFSVEHSY